MGISFLLDSYLYGYTVVWMYSPGEIVQGLPLKHFFTYIQYILFLLPIYFPPAQPGSCCMRGGVNRMQRMLNTVTSRMGLWSPPSPEDEEGGNSLYGSPGGAVGTFRINAPGQRFTATHGIAMRKGMEKNMM